MNDVIADQNYFYDADGNVTTDESKGVRWLVREGANVLEEHREALKAFQGADNSKVAPEDEAEEKSAKPSANKKETPSKNKGVKK